jgi:hypothetical protein
MTPEQEDKLVNEINIEAEWSKWRTSGLIRTLFGPSSKRESDVAKVFAEHIRNMAITSTRKQTLEWISVKDRLPEEHNTYIVSYRANYFNADTEIHSCPARWIGNWYSMDSDGCGTYGFAYEITHWMPLPAPLPSSPAATDSINADELSAARKESQ